MKEGKLMAESKHFIEYNANPYMLNIKDCSVRALSKLFDIPYFYAYALLMENQSKTKAPSFKTTHNIDNLLSKELHMVEHEFTGNVNKLALMLREPAYVFVKAHAVYAEHKKFYDTWDSGRKHVEKYFTIGDDTYTALEHLLNNIKGMG